MTRQGAGIAIVLGVTAATIAAGSSLAQSGGFSGYVELEYIFAPGDDTKGVAADFSYSIAPGDLGFGPLGLDSGFRGLFLDGDDYTAIYLAPTIGLGSSGRIGMGIPRPAMAGLYDGPALGGSRIFDAEVGALTDSVTETAYLFRDGGAPGGLRYDGDYGDLQVAASAHRFFSDDVNTYELALKYQIGAVRVSGGVSHGDAPGGDVTNAVVGVSGSQGNLAGGLYLFQSDFAGNDLSGGRGYFTFSPSDRIDLSATALVLDGGNDALGASVTYGFNAMGYAQAGALRTDADTYYDLSLGVKF